MKGTPEASRVGTSWIIRMLMRHSTHRHPIANGSGTELVVQERRDALEGGGACLGIGADVGRAGRSTGQPGSGMDLDVRCVEVVVRPGITLKLDRLAPSD